MTEAEIRESLKSDHRDAFAQEHKLSPPMLWVLKAMAAGVVFKLSAFSGVDIDRSGVFEGTFYSTSPGYRITSSTMDALEARDMVHLRRASLREAGTGLVLGEWRLGAKTEVRSAPVEHHGPEPSVDLSALRVRKASFVSLDDISAVIGVDLTSRESKSVLVLVQGEERALFVHSRALDLARTQVHDLIGILDGAEERRLRTTGLDRDPTPEPVLTWEELGEITRALGKLRALLSE